MKNTYQTCTELFEQRGYKIQEKDDEIITGKKKNGKLVFAFIVKTNKFNVEKIQEYISIMKKTDVWHSIIVYKDTVTPVAKKTIEESKEMVIELFHEDEMQYNITKHYLVPKHELLFEKGTKGAKEFKEKYGDTFPILLKSDPISRFYGYNKGDIIKVTRKNGIVVHRIVK